MMMTLTVMLTTVSMETIVITHRDI